MILTPTEFCKIPGIPAAAQEAYTLLHVEWTRERQAAEFWYTQKDVRVAGSWKSLPTTATTIGVGTNGGDRWGRSSADPRPEHTAWPSLLEVC